MSHVVYNSTMHVHDYELPFMKYPSYRAGKGVLLFTPPILLCIGTVGNIFSFCILRQSMNKVSTYFYLAILSIADLIVIYVGLLRLWAGELSGYDVRNGSDFMCKTVITIGYIFSDFSVWLIVAVTSERFIAVCHPLKATFMCSVRRARIITLCIFISTVVLNVHFLWTVSVSQMTLTNTSQPIYNCEAQPRFQYVLDDVWPFVDAVVYSLAPCLIMAVLNCVIIRQIIIAKRLRYQLQNCNQRKSSRRGPLYAPVSRIPSEGSIKLTTMLLVVSCVFMLTTLPNSVLVIVKATLPLNTGAEIAQIYLLSTVTEMVMYVNHCINFFLYCATGNKFRRHIMRIICKLKHFHRRSRDHRNSMVLTRFSFSGGQGQRFSLYSMHNRNDSRGGLRKSLSQ